MTRIQQNKTKKTTTKEASSRRNAGTTGRCLAHTCHHSPKPHPIDDTTTCQALPTKEGVYIGVVLFRPDNALVAAVRTTDDARRFFAAYFPQFVQLLREEDLEVRRRVVCVCALECRGHGLAMAGVLIITQPQPPISRSVITTTTTTITTKTTDDANPNPRSIITITTITKTTDNAYFPGVRHRPDLPPAHVLVRGPAAALPQQHRAHGRHHPRRQAILRPGLRLGAAGERVVGSLPQKKQK